MFNLCLLKKGRKDECIDQLEVCERQISNLEHEINLLDKHSLNTKLKTRMEYVCNRLRQYVRDRENPSILKK
tara:strand:+ start:471 stop:686 length:216 start_codon:yes stop_codon:yes gene_type:complete